jgi:NADH-quinone oxidoreductase subunit F
LTGCHLHVEKLSYQPVTDAFVREPHAYTLDSYVKHARGYEALRKALTLKPNDIIEQVKASGCAGAAVPGFPTG